MSDDRENWQAGHTPSPTPPPPSNAPAEFSSSPPPQTQPYAGQPAPAQQGYAPQGAPAPMPYQAGGYPAYQVQPRNPLLYALASFLVAGLGTMLGGHVGRGVVILGVVFFLAVLMFIPFLGLLVIPFWLLAWAWSVFDGYRTAQKWNEAHGIVS